MSATIAANMPLTADKYGDTLKIVQTGFYIVASIVALLTYRAARRGLLNTVNTEYQKRVMDRLQKLSEDLYSEFDPKSPNYWVTTQPVHKAVEHVNMVYENNKEQILQERKYYWGTPCTADELRLRNLLDPIVSDPFIPDNIREAVVDLLETRISVLGSIYHREFEKYATNLAKGKHEPFTELDDVNALHNKIVDQQRNQGCGIEQIEGDVHEIRALIQDYFDSFNPHRRWWHGKRKRSPRKLIASGDSWPLRHPSQQTPAVCSGPSPESSGALAAPAFAYSVSDFGRSWRRPGCSLERVTYLCIDCASLGCSLRTLASAGTVVAS